MKLGKKAIIYWIMLSVLHAHAQDPDYYSETLTAVKGSSFIQSSNDLDVKVSLYSFEEYLSLVVEVKDEFLDINPSEYLADHIELFFALPQDAYPDEFQAGTHPYYLYAPPFVSRGLQKEEKGRFFSSPNDAMVDMEVEAFLAENNYPDTPDIRKDSLKIPYASHLSRRRIDYGIVHYGLFPDQRAPILYNKKYHRIIEKNLNIKLGAVESGITYVVDRNEDGYTLTAQIEPKALGFVRLPEMKSIYFSLDVIDTDGIKQAGYSVLSVSQGGSHSMKDRTFIEVPLNRALNTNFSEAPDRIYRKTNYFPTYTYTEKGWTPTAIEVDALFYDKQRPSNQFSEVQFKHRPQRYRLTTFPRKYLSFEQFDINYEYVNLLGRTVQYTLIYDHVFRSQIMRASKNDSISPLPKQVFFFSDGKPGLILLENATLSPYGWGENGHLLDERIRVMRVLKDEVHELLRIEQGDGEDAYCYIGKLSYPGFFVEKINWAKEGEIMVIWLQNRADQARKRVRVSWQADGSDIEVQELP